MLIHRISKGALADDSQRLKGHFPNEDFTGENNTDSSSANAEARDSRDPRSLSRFSQGEISNNEKINFAGQDLNGVIQLQCSF